MARTRKAGLAAVAVAVAVGLSATIGTTAGGSAQADWAPAVLSGAGSRVGGTATGSAGNWFTAGFSPYTGSAAAFGWVGGWAAALTGGGTGKDTGKGTGGGTGGGTGIVDRTVRMVVHDTVPGSSVRLRLSNIDGAHPVSVGAVDIAVQADGGSAVPGSRRSVTFSGSATVTIPARADVTSDPVAMTVSAGENLLVSIYFPRDAGPSGWHFDAREVTYLSAPGNFAAKDTTQGYPAADDSWYYLDGLDVRSTTARCTLVAFGDSITNGDGSAVSANSRWPDLLARRLAAMPGGPAFGVVDEGLDGNRLLTSTISAFGRSGLHRFAHDVLGQPGVRDVIVLEGINDIDGGTGPGGSLTAQDLINGYRTLIAEAHADGVKIYGATILPYQAAFYYTSAGEAIRETVNHWIRTSGAYDGIFDLAAAVPDPSDPLRLNPAYDSGDHLHPNDAGYQAMASAIDLTKLTC
jgi:lysophospholipase L1-like esterase